MNSGRSQEARGAARLRLGGAVLVLLVVIPLALWRLALVRLGPDPDSDAYGHFAIAREVLVHPKNLEAHWVWLPLFHYLSAAAVWLGATMNTVRAGNALLTALSPLVLFALVSDRRAGDRAPSSRRLSASRVGVAALAAVFFALNPIAMQMGTTGQTEPLFCLLMLVAAREATRGNFTRLGVALAAAALVRYEAWAAWLAASGLLAFGLLAAPRFSSARGVGRARASLGLDGGTPRELLWTGGALWVALLPALGILSWALARAANGEPFFGFLRQTHDFARDALHGSPSALDRLDDATYYAVKTPLRVLAEPLWLVPFGIVATTRRLPWFVLLHGAMLAFVTATWMSHSQLGLDRHFTSIAPLYATFMAEGVFTLSAGTARLGKRVGVSRGSGAATFAIVTALALFFGGRHLQRWMVDWTNAIRGDWPAERAVATFLRSTDPRSTLVCNDPLVEGVSELGRRRFDRDVVLAPEGPLSAPPMAAADQAHLRSLARAGETWVVTTEANAKRLVSYGTVGFRTPEGAAPRLVVLRVE